MGTAHWCWQGETRQTRERAHRGKGRPLTWSTGLQLEKQPVGKGNKIPMWSEAFKKASPEPGSRNNFEYNWQKATEPPHPILVQNTNIDPWQCGEQRKENLYIYGMWIANNLGRRDDSFHIYKFTGREMLSGSYLIPNGTNHTQLRKGHFHRPGKEMNSMGKLRL